MSDKITTLNPLDCALNEAQAFREQVGLLQAENTKLLELLQTLQSSHDKMCTQRGNCFGCAFFYEDDTACPYVKVCQSMRKLGVEVRP